MTATAICLLPTVATPASAGEHSQAVTKMLNDADQALANGNIEEALRLCRQADKEEPNSEDIHNELGLCYTHQKRFHDAAGEFQKAFEISPEYMPALHNLGSVLYRGGYYAEAIAWLKKEVESQPTNASTITTLADAYRDRASFQGKVNDYENAFKYYNQALEADPNSATAHNHLGVYYFQRGQFEAAEREIQRAIELKNDYAAAYYNLGLLQAKQHNMTAAAAAFNNSLRHETESEYKAQVKRKMHEFGIAVDDAEPLTKAYDLLSQAKWTEAAQLLKGMTKANPNDSIAWNNLGYALFKQGLHRDAISAYKTAINTSQGKFASAEYNLGVVLRSTHDPAKLKEAETWLKKAIEHSGNTHALAYNALGLVYKDEHKLEEARKAYRLAIAQSGDTLPVAHYNYALSLKNEPGLKDRAIEELQLYLKHAPNGTNRESAKAQLGRLKGH